MLSKNDCREFLLRVKPYVKLSLLAKEYGIPQSRLSSFMSNEFANREISTDNINGFVVYVQNRIYDIVT